MIQNAALDLIPSFPPYVEGSVVVYEEVDLAGLLWRFLGCVPIGMNVVGILKVSLNVNNNAICNKTF
jgi:hypothetical protein